VLLFCDVLGIGGMIRRIFATRPYQYLLLSHLGGPSVDAATDWAMTHNNLGKALTRLGERESGTVRLQEAVSAYQNTLLERMRDRMRDRVPLYWAATQNNLGNA